MSIIISGKATVSLWLNEIANIKPCQADCANLPKSYYSALDIIKLKRYSTNYQFSGRDK